MKMHNDIKSDTDKTGKKFHIIYSKNGKEHRLGLLEDAIAAIQTGHYSATKPVVEKKLRKAK